MNRLILKTLLVFFVVPSLADLLAGRIGNEAQFGIHGEANRLDLRGTAGGKSVCTFGGGHNSDVCVCIVGRVD